MLNILIGQLPPDVTEELVRERLSGVSGIKEVKVVREGSPDKVTAVVGIDASRPAAEFVVRKINGLYFRGRRLRAHLMLAFPEE